MKLFYWIKTVYTYEKDKNPSYYDEQVVIGSEEYYCQEFNCYLFKPKFEIRRRKVYNVRTIIKRIYHVYEFRKEPVPKTGKKIWKFRNFYKYPRTRQEKIWNERDIKYVRGNRHPKNLINVRDENPRSDVFIKHSWKKQKIKKQWMKNLK
jgi:hypothetical protein